ncbi:MAG: hypothetical protein AAB956_03000 [Patescibacteria group bacterium]
MKDAADINAIKKAMEELNSVAQKIGAAMYQAASAQGASASQAGQNGGEKKKDEPVEGEVVDEKK